jgi:Sec-independent protein secretion pathway component TatC
MMLMAVPLYLLYELGLFTLKVMPVEKVVRGVKEAPAAGDD